MRAQWESDRMVTDHGCMFLQAIKAEMTMAFSIAVKPEMRDVIS